MSVLERPLGASLAQRPFVERLPRRRRKTAWVAAVICPLLLTLGQRALGSSVPPAAILFVTLLVVVVVALLDGLRPALAAIVTGLIAQEVLFEFPYGSLSNHEPAQISIFVVFVVIRAGIGILVDELARHGALSPTQLRLARRHPSPRIVPKGRPICSRLPSPRQAPTWSHRRRRAERNPSTIRLVVQADAASRAHSMSSYLTASG